MSQNLMSISTRALPARSYWTTADYCAYPVASMESEALALPETLPPGVTL
ncbi:hypothetical protein RSO68_08195 [Halomonas saccharevitans]|uniref:Uncharacterized protein n=1 Tax=Halomonas saccharevitans TaxID=416872 RepID=A0ABU3NH05_9GAMM|nr:hypothetical protein [Halomonas saccharevitans]MDT8879446.1 hypothetical protein [Halomonas saccharevitans]